MVFGRLFPAVLAAGELNVRAFTLEEK